MIIRKQVEALHALGPTWLAQFLADLVKMGAIDKGVMLQLLAAYADVSKGYIRARPQ